MVFTVILLRKKLEIEQRVMEIVRNIGRDKNWKFNHKGTKGEKSLVSTLLRLTVSHMFLVQTVFR